MFIEALRRFLRPRLMVWFRNCAAPRFRFPVASPKARQDSPRWNSNILLGHARGSLMEVETYILLAQELSYIESDQSESLLARTAEVGKILNGLLNSLGRGTDHCFRKFSTSFFPASVSTLSGWNCTPSTAHCRWRRPMMVRVPSFSVVQALISSSAGRFFSSTMSE